jgi:hypothetical protein
MARSLLFGSVLLCLLCVGLSQVLDPGVFGIDEEPERIAFYGGAGLLGGLSGLIALVSGIYLGAIRFADISEDQRRFMLTIIAIVVIAVIFAIVIRLYPT